MMQILNEPLGLDTSSHVHRASHGDALASILDAAITLALWERSSPISAIPPDFANVRLQTLVGATVSALGNAIHAGTNS